MYRSQIKVKGGVYFSFYRSNMRMKYRESAIQNIYENILLPYIFLERVEWQWDQD